MFNPKHGYPETVPYLRYTDPEAALVWLGEVLGATEAVRLTLPDGKIGHAELRLGQAAVIAIGLTSSPSPAEVPTTRATARAMTLVFVNDVDHATRRALELNGTLIDEPTTMPWGLRQSIVADPDGHLWELTTFHTNVNAADWGAQTTGPWMN